MELTYIPTDSRLKYGSSIQQKYKEHYQIDKLLGKIKAEANMIVIFYQLWFAPVDKH